MSKRFYTQATVALSLVLAAYAGGIAKASHEFVGHVNYAQSNSIRSHHKARAAVKHSRTAKSAGAELRGKSQHSSAASAGPGNFTPQQRRDYGEWMRKSSDSVDLAKQGDTDAKNGKWNRAAAQYQAALTLWPDNPDGLYGMGQCAAAAGDLPRAISDYRLAVYADKTKEPGSYGTVPGDGFQTNDIKRLMEFALLLGRVGQTQESVFIYNRAAALMDYERGDVQHGEPSVKVLLPELVAGQPVGNQAPYTPEHLQALAETALAYSEMSFGSNKEAIGHMRDAVKLFPDSATVQYYLGEALSGSYYVMLDSPAKDKVAARAAYEDDKKGQEVAYKKAAELGNETTRAAAKERAAMIR